MNSSIVFRFGKINRTLRNHGQLPMSDFNPSFQKLISVTEVNPNGNETHHGFVEGLHKIYFAVMIATVLSNTAVFLLIISHKKILKKHSSKFFLNLQVVHLGLSISSIISSFIKWGMELFIKNALLMMMFFCLFMMSCERYLAIKAPYKYGKITSQHVNDMVLCSWIPPVVFVGLAKLFEHPIERDLMMSIGIISVAAVVLSILNLSIYITVRKHFSAIRKHKHRNSLANLNVSKEKKRLKSAYVCFAIVFSFFVLWCPYFMYNVLRVLKVYQYYDLRFTESVQPFSLLNSLIDPILFVFFRQDAKKELKRILGVRKFFTGKHTLAHAECIPMAPSIV